MKAKIKIQYWNDNLKHTFQSDSVFISKEAKEIAEKALIEFEELFSKHTRDKE